MTNFVEFPKIARWSRDIIVTEKIDGTNAQVVIDLAANNPSFGVLTRVEDFVIGAGSRNRYLTRETDNFGFAKWVEENAQELVKLGPGRHYGEWWGSGIQRGYGLPKGEKRFSLFNVSRWGVTRPACCSVVPTLYSGPNDEARILDALASLAEKGSVAAPGFMDPEGIIVFHTASNQLFKKTLKDDEVPKALAAKVAA